MSVRVSGVGTTRLTYTAVTFDKHICNVMAAQWPEVLAAPSQLESGKANPTSHNVGPDHSTSGPIYSVRSLLRNLVLRMYGVRVVGLVGLGGLGVPDHVRVLVGLGVPDHVRVRVVGVSVRHGLDVPDPTTGLGVVQARTA